MRTKVIIVTIILTVNGCLSISPIKKEVLINSVYIKMAAFAEGVPESLKFYRNFFQDKIVVMGRSALRIIEKEDIRRTKYLKYEISTWKPSLIRANDKVYIVAGGGGFSDVGLMNNKGELLWKYKPDSKLHPFDMEGDDLNKDGIPEFYVGTHDGLHILDMNGKLVKKTDSLWINDLEIGQYNGEDVIIGLSRNVFYFWDYKGNLLKRIDVEENFSQFEIVDWPQKNHFLTKKGSKIYLIDMEGNIIFEREIGRRIYDISGTAVFFDESRRTYLAIVADYSSRYNRSLLSIFSPDGKIIYKEIIGSTQAIIAVDKKLRKSQYLLVGGFPMISKYDVEKNVTERVQRR
jgi:hypothetical protein